MVVNCLTIWIVILYEFVWNMRKFTNKNLLSRYTVCRTGGKWQNASPVTAALISLLYSSKRSFTNSSSQARQASITSISFKNGCVIRVVNSHVARLFSGAGPESGLGNSVTLFWSGLPWKSWVINDVYLSRNIWIIYCSCSHKT